MLRSATARPWYSPAARLCASASPPIDEGHHLSTSKIGGSTVNRWSSHAPKNDKLPTYQYVECWHTACAAGSGIMDPIALGERPQALLTMLYRSTDRRCRRGAPMVNLAHSASLPPLRKDRTIRIRDQTAPSRRSGWHGSGRGRCRGSRDAGSVAKSACGRRR